MGTQITGPSSAVHFATDGMRVHSLVLLAAAAAQVVCAVVTLPSARATTTATAKAVLIGRKWRQLPASVAGQYRGLMERHYLPMSAAQQCLLRGSADGVGQLLSGA